MAKDEPVGHLAPLGTGLPVAPTLAARLVGRLGGRYSTEMGIDLDAGGPEIERWFVASTLFGTRIAARVAERTFAVLERSGIHRISDVAGRGWDQLVTLLDSGGYARYDFRTATRLQNLAGQVADRYGGEVTEIGRRFAAPEDVAAALDDLAGWGPVTVGLFLRELRGLWPGACPPLDRRAAAAGRHLGLLPCDDDGQRGDQRDGQLDRLALVARLSGCDLRDLEAALVRAALAHPKTGHCPGGRACPVVAPPVRHPTAAVRTVHLPGRRRTTVRPMRPGDGPGLVALYAGLDPDDVYRRFFTAHPPPRPFVMKMAAVAQCGGSGLVATIDDVAATGTGVTAGDGRSRAGSIVAEATYTPLPNGNAELGITVARGARGWLGPYLLDALLEDAADHGIPNVEADVLLTNAQMLAMLRRRGYAVIGFEEQPALARLVVGSVGKAPSWPGPHVDRRVLVETPGGRWQADAAARHAGFEVIGCPSPAGGWETCLALGGEPCPLAADADVIVTAVPGSAGRSLLDAHRRTHPAVPLCVELADGDPDPGPVAARIPRGAPGSVVAAILGQVARPVPCSATPATVPGARCRRRGRPNPDVRPCGPSLARPTIAPWPTTGLQPGNQPDEA